jgi:hypothetical protein
LVQVSNKVRKRILSELFKQNLSLTELAKITGKAQSTLSVHLDRMVDEGLVNYVSDPNDNRRKIYSLTSMLLASSKNLDPAATEMSVSVLKEVVEDPSAMHLVLLRSLMLAADGMGLYVGPLIRTLGVNLANAVKDVYNFTKVEDLMNKVKTLYESIGFGEVSIYTFLPLTIIVKDKFEMTRASAEVSGLFAQGFFLTSLKNITGKDYVMTDHEIFGAGNNYYKMVIEQLKQ